MRELGDKLGVTEQYVCNVERGHYQFPKTFCLRLMPFLDRERKIYLTDMLAELATDHALRGIGEHV
jgi:DNA-binding XRE family transcriptional regulator